MTKFALKIRSRHGDSIVTELNNDSTIQQLINIAEGLAGGGVNILTGFPPKRLDITKYINTNTNITLNELGICSGDTITLQEASSSNTPVLAAPAPVSVSSSNATSSAAPSSVPFSHKLFLKKPVPADNSCLFTSIGFCINGRVDTSVGSYMREIIAQVVSNDKETYSEGFLGRPNLEYCTWIMDADSWGGAIEISVLSRFYGIEMDVVDTLNAIINRFGEDENYGQRVFLFFDGIHYDPLYLEGPQGEIQTIFPIEDEDVLREAEELAREAKSSRQITYTFPS